MPFSGKIGGIASVASLLTGAGLAISGGVILVSGNVPLGAGLLSAGVGTGALAAYLASPITSQVNPAPAPAQNLPNLPQQQAQQQAIQLPAPAQHVAINIGNAQPPAIQQNTAVTAAVGGNPRNSRSRSTSESSRGGIEMQEARSRSGTPTSQSRSI